uniref:C2H2-type domain-containing protein n=1 Tax=Poecilia reticulata TaxID=8081 RepID=A0A3P9MXV8_POERE
MYQPLNSLDTFLNVLCVSMFPADVKQMLVVKEEDIEDEKPNMDLYDLKLYHIKEEEEGVCISLGEELQNVKEEIESAIKREDDKQSPLLSQLYQHQMKDRELPEGNNEGDFIKTEDREDDFNFLESEDTKKEEEDDDVKHPVQTREKFNCEDCGKTFIRKQNLSRHMRSHTGQKPFCCDLCGHRFSEKSYLTAHMRIHTGQKPFSCDICGHKFNQRAHLIMHMRIHTGHKPFCCDICGHRFSQKANLIMHMRIHTGEKPFCCDLCGHRFSQKSYLTRHMIIHTGQKPFCCDICGHRFSKKFQLSSPEWPICITYI